jgi:uncharacterized protein YuzE
MLVNERMEHVNKNRFVGPRSTGKPPTIEFDPSIDAWYVRFRTARVAKTISEDKPGPVVAVDLDASNRVIGLEIIGVREFSIRWLRETAPFDLSGFDLEGAKFVHPGPRQTRQVATRLASRT